MNDSRRQILKRVQQALQRKETKVDIKKAFALLTQQRDQAVQPPHAGNIIDTFIQAAKNNAAVTHRIGSIDEFATWLTQYATELNQQPPLVLSSNSSELAVQLSTFTIHKLVQQAESWGIVKAYAGIAETGTVVSTSRDCASGMLFLVERLIVILEQSDIIAYQEDVWQKLQQRFNGKPPRTVNLITGPSRTADVEQTIQLGAHGPCWVDYVIIRN